jgi:hypothetical protein
MLPKLTMGTTIIRVIRGGQAYLSGHFQHHPSIEISPQTKPRLLAAIPFTPLVLAGLRP